jgi:hypothetical protein
LHISTRKNGAWSSQVIGTNIVAGGEDELPGMVSQGTVNCGKQKINTALRWEAKE